MSSRGNTPDDPIGDEIREVGAKVHRLLRDPNGGDRPAGDVAYLDLPAIRANGLPPIPWLLPGWLAERDVMVLAGAGGIGKSTTVADMAIALAAGRPWCSIEPTRPLRVLMFDEEQDETTAARLLLRLGALDAGERLRVAVAQGIRLDTPEGVERLENAIEEHGADVVVGDSVQQLFGGAKENDATEVGQVYGNLFRLRDRLGVAFVLVHHKRKTQPGALADALEMVRGSTAHGTQASVVVYAAAGAHDRLHLRQVKRRGAEKRSLVVAYTAEADGPIRLEGEGDVDEAETPVLRCMEWLAAYLEEHDEARTGELREACAKALTVNARTVERALSELGRLGAVERPRRGVFRLAKRAARTLLEPTDEEL